MPEGPSIVILKEAILPFEGKLLTGVKGNGDLDFSIFEKEKLVSIRTWGKQIFLCFRKCTIRIHLLMFGAYSVNEQTRPDKSLRLGIFFKTGSVYFYTCSVTVFDGDLEKWYDWKADIMSDLWDPAKARRKLKSNAEILVCDALMDQQIFSGVGNIIKNEVLYRVRLHPETPVGKIPPRKMTALITEVRAYGFDFLKWKKADV
ncbi:MAG: endonuclease, partial [Chitinophagaceae bacterium]